MSVPEDAFRAAQAAGHGVNLLDQIAAALEFTASQLQPALGALEAELGGRTVDAPSFALGLMSSTFLMQGLDIIECVKMAPVQFSEFLVRCEAMQGRTVCAHRSASFPSVTCGLDPDHDGKHAAGRLRW